MMTLSLAAGLLAAGALVAQSPPAGSAPFVNTVDAFQRSQYSDRAAVFPRPQLHRDIHTAVPLAGTYFDAGLSLYYAYRHAESVRMFREAQRLDSRCVMCVIGEAIALGPAVDAAMDSASETRALSADVACIGRHSPCRATYRQCENGALRRTRGVPSA